MVSSTLLWIYADLGAGVDSNSEDVPLASAYPIYMDASLLVVPRDVDKTLG